MSLRHNIIIYCLICIELIGDRRRYMIFNASKLLLCIFECNIKSKLIAMSANKKTQENNRVSRNWNNINPPSFLICNGYLHTICFLCIETAKEEGRWRTWHEHKKLKRQHCCYCSIIQNKRLPLLTNFRFLRNNKYWNHCKNSSLQLRFKSGKLPINLSSATNLKMKIINNQI